MRSHPTPQVLPPLDILRPARGPRTPPTPSAPPLTSILLSRQRLILPVHPTTNPPKATPDAIPPGSSKRRMIPGGWIRLQRPSSARPPSAARTDSTSSHASPTMPSSTALPEDHRKRPRSRTNDAAKLPTERDDDVHAKRAKHVRTKNAHSL